MKNFTLALLCLLLTCCEFRVEPQQRTYAYQTERVETCAYGGRYDDPYNYSPEWCDWYSDNSLCCVWYDTGWYEEWCQWGNSICWEYNGYW